MKEQIAEWLRSLEGTTDVEPVILTIGMQTWFGAVYTQRGKQHYYLVGFRPHQRGPKTCYRFAGDDRDWYVACYMNNYNDLPPVPKSYHPFGNNWMMMAWDAPGSIDNGEKPYRRMKVTVA